jgi:DNA primase large subunit
MRAYPERLLVKDLANYFWSTQAAEYIRDKEIDIQTLDQYADVISEAESWINATLERGLLSPSPNAKPETVMLAYPTVRMFVTILGNEYLLRRFANAVSKLAGTLLDKEENEKILLLATTPGNIGEKPWRLVYQKATPERKDYIAGMIYEWKLFFTDYISVAQNFHDAKWKLVNRRLEEGWVHLLRSDVARLMEEALKTRITKSGMRPTRELPRPEEMPPTLRRALERISDKVKKWSSEFQTYDAEGGAGEIAYPGCIKQILDKLDKGLGVSHSERLALVFFLSNVGKDVDEILQVFSKSPDFDAQRSRYYVEHAMGLRGGGTKYKPYGCPKLKTYGLCNPQDEWCRNGRIGPRILRGPIGFYKSKSWYLAKRKEEERKSTN